MSPTAASDGPRLLTRARCLREAAFFLFGLACPVTMSMVFGSGLHSPGGMALGTLLGYSFALGDRGGWLLLARRVARGERLLDPASIPGRACPAGLLLAQSRAVGSLLMMTLIPLVLLAWPMSSFMQGWVWGLYALVTVMPAVLTTIALRRYMRRYARQNAVDEALVTEPAAQTGDAWWSQEKRDAATLRNGR